MHHYVYSVQSALYSVHSLENSIVSTPSTVLYNKVQFTQQSKLNSLQCTSCAVHYTVYLVKRTLYTVKCTVYSVRRRVYYNHCIPYTAVHPRSLSRSLALALSLSRSSNYRCRS